MPLAPQKVIMVVSHLFMGHLCSSHLREGVSVVLIESLVESVCLESVRLIAR